MGCSSCGRKRVLRVTRSSDASAPSILRVSEDRIVDTITIEYVGQKHGAFSWPGSSGRRYRFNPPSRREVDVAREDVVGFLERGDFRLAGGPLPPIARPAAPVQAPITVAAFQSRAQRAATEAVREADRPTPPQVVEQQQARARELVGGRAASMAEVATPAPTYAQRRRRVPRVVDEKRTPKWTPKGL